MTSTTNALGRAVEVGRRGACAAAGRVVGELPLTGRRSSLALRLAPGSRSRQREVDLGGVRVQVGDGTDEERMLHHWPRPLLRHYERSPLGRALAGVEPGLFADVGSNLGMYAVIAYRNGWRAVRYEPDARLLDHHRRNAFLGDFHPVALAATPGRRRFFADQVPRGAASLVALNVDDPGGADGSSTVVTETADTSLLPVVDDAGGPVLVKIDVEGAEAEVVAGAAELLGRARPVLWCEVRGSASGRAPSSDVAVVAALPPGYRVFACDDGTLVPADGGRGVGVYDILAVPDRGASAALGGSITAVLSP